MVEKFKLFFELDDYGFSNRKPKCLQEPVDVLEWLIIHIRSLQNQYPKVGQCIIKRSGNGYHCYLPDCPSLSEEEFQKIMLLCPHDVGWNFFNMTYGLSTLRIGEKPIVTAVKKGEGYTKRLGMSIGLEKPQVIRIVNLDGSVLCRKEIEERYGRYCLMKDFLLKCRVLFWRKKCRYWRTCKFYRFNHLKCTTKRDRNLPTIPD